MLLLDIPDCKLEEHTRVLEGYLIFWSKFPSITLSETYSSMSSMFNKSLNKMNPNQKLYFTFLFVENIFQQIITFGFGKKSAFAKP